MEAVIMVDIGLAGARHEVSLDARGPPLGLASCVSRGENPPLISSKFGHGGARANSGGARENSGGHREGAGRPPRAAVHSTHGDMMRWYVAVASHGQGEQADWDIRSAGFDVVTARVWRSATPSRRTEAGSFIAARPERYDLIFGRYIVVRFCLSGPGWPYILELDSVDRIVSGSHLRNNGIGIPISIPDAEIDHFRKKLSADGCLYPFGHHTRIDPDKPMARGTALRLTKSALAGQPATCDVSDGFGIKMLMNMFNRDNVKVSASQTSVEKAVVS